MVALDHCMSDLEHRVRVMHRMCTLDASYVETSETMHRLHEERYQRATGRMASATPDEGFLHAQYQTALTLFQADDLEVEHALLRPICRRLATGEYATPSDQRLLFLCSYNAVCARLGLSDEFEAHTERLILLRRQDGSDAAFDAYCRQMYALMLLQSHRYSLTAPYIPYLQSVHVRGLGISPATSSFDTSPDAPARCVLVYFAGGIGDKVMFARLVEPFVVAFPRHAYVVLVDERLVWMFRQVWCHLSNVRLVPYGQRGRIPAFQHHLNINTLLAHLGVTYTTIPAPSYLRTIETRVPTARDDASLRAMLHETKRNVLINWRGTRSAQVVDRSIPVATLETLLTRTSAYVHWIALCTDLQPSDVETLTKWNVTVPTATWDKDHAFVDSIALMRVVDLVLSVDTSTLHISGSIGVPTWGMLVVGCDWRWKSSDADTQSNWYPDVRLFRQTRRREWTDVLSRIEGALQSEFGGLPG